MPKGYPKKPRKAAGAQSHRDLHGPTAKTVRCLKCGKDFLSEGPWNRICPTCTDTQPRLGVRVCKPHIHPG